MSVRPSAFCNANYARSRNAPGRTDKSHRCHTGYRSIFVIFWQVQDVPLGRLYTSIFQLSECLIIVNMQTIVCTFFLILIPQHFIRSVEFKLIQPCSVFVNITVHTDLLKNIQMLFI